MEYYFLGFIIWLLFVGAVAYFTYPYALLKLFEKRIPFTMRWIAYRWIWMAYVVFRNFTRDMFHILIWRFVVGVLWGIIKAIYMNVLDAPKELDSSIVSNHNGVKHKAVQRLLRKIDPNR